MTAPVVELFPNEAPQAPSPQRQANDEEWKSVEVRLGNHDTRLASHEHRLDRLWDFGTKVALLFAGVIVGRVTAPQAQETSASSGGGRAQVSAAGASVAASTPATLPPSPALPPPASAQPPAAAPPTASAPPSAAASSEARSAEVVSRRPTQAQAGHTRPIVLDSNADKQNTIHGRCRVGSDRALRCSAQSGDTVLEFVHSNHSSFTETCRCNGFSCPTAEAANDLKVGQVIVLPQKVGDVWSYAGCPFQPPFESPQRN